ncbi:MAG: asparagine synthase (glutamine-hydrolyzing) [Anaerolineae bacterium]
MCGIWGTVNMADEEMAGRAAAAMRHRGPDDHGVFVAHEPLPAALVNTRLSIIDLSPAGHQPMSTPDGRYWIVYNGEVYNFQAIRTLLADLGHQFSSHTDTEVILHAYQEWGAACLEHLRGMFAFAIWDRAEGRLFAARDRLGIKPLYYTFEDETGRFAFASEIKALLVSGLVARRLNYAALHHYLSFYAVPSPYTLFEQVNALPPGHFLTLENGRLHIERYWNLPAYAPLTLSEEEIRLELRRLLEEAIRLRMIADVQVGAFLSGGIDSSAVVALMTRISGERLRTFSIGFEAEGSSIDERSAARVLAEHYQTDHTEVIVTGRDVRDQLRAIIRALDQPSGDGLNTYLVSQATARHVKVALSGLGGDELFAGYPQFSLFERFERIRRMWGAFPDLARNAVRGAGSVLPIVRRAVTWLDGDILARYGRVRVLYDEAAKLALYSPETRSALAAPEPSLQYLASHLHPAETDIIAQLTRLELKNYMAHTLLRDTDAMSMAHSLEVRVPLIDHKLVEFAVRIPPGLKLRNGRGKHIFIEALRDVLPQQVLTRPKRGFEMPIGAWMRNDLRDVMEDVFSTRSIQRRGLFQVEPMQRIYAGFKEGRGIYMHAWAFAVLELWMREFVDGDVTRA